MSAPRGCEDWVRTGLGAGSTTAVGVLCGVSDRLSVLQATTVCGS